MASNYCYYLREKTLYRFTCEICVERKPYNTCFGIKGCNHSYCSDCISKYINSKLDDNVVHIDCPVSGCPGLLDPDHCRSIIAHQVFDRWGSALREASIPHVRKFYCPYKDCSALLLLTDDYHGVTRSECPYCQRFLCVQSDVNGTMGSTVTSFRSQRRPTMRRMICFFTRLQRRKGGDSVLNAIFILSRQMVAALPVADAAAVISVTDVDLSSVIPKDNFPCCTVTVGNLELPPVRSRKTRPS